MSRQGVFYSKNTWSWGKARSLVKSRPPKSSVEELLSYPFLFLCFALLFLSFFPLSLPDLSRNFLPLVFLVFIYFILYSNFSDPIKATFKSNLKILCVRHKKLENKQNGEKKSPVIPPPDIIIIILMYFNK